MTTSMSSSTRDKILNYRKNEFSQLNNRVYLDNAGSGIPSNSYIKQMANDFQNNVYTNPHSQHSLSMHTANIIDEVRMEILKLFNTDSSKYSLIFTPGTTDSCKLLGANFCWNNNLEQCSTSFIYINSKDPQHETNISLISDALKCKRSCFIYLESNHTSVVGMRELADQQRALSICIREEDLYKAITDDDLEFKDINKYACFNVPPADRSNTVGLSDIGLPYRAYQQEVRSRGLHLLAYPAICNFSGKRYPMSWSDTIAIEGMTLNSTHFNSESVRVFIDAAAAVSTSYIDLLLHSPHFMAFSFYKLLGFPTGLGALIVRNDCIELLTKRYFGGGTVDNYSSRHNFYHRKNAEFFEDGTVSFQSIIAVQHGLKSFYSLNLSLREISLYTFALVNYVYTNLASLKHYNGTPVCEIYSSQPPIEETTQGSILAFNILRSDGRYVGYNTVANVAEPSLIFLRTGCFCNMGACQQYLQLSDAQMLSIVQAGHVCGDAIDIVDGIPTGAVRISFGVYNTLEDAIAFVNFINKHFVETSLQDKANTDTLMEMPLATLNISDNSEKNIFIHELAVYPIKACKGFKPKCWSICNTGLVYDRKWVLVNEKNVPLNQKIEPKLCFIQTNINLEARIMSLDYPGMQSISFAISENANGDKAEAISAEEIPCRIRVCGQRVQVVKSPEEVNSWLTSVIGYHVVLMERKVCRVAKHIPIDYKETNIPLNFQGIAHLLMVSIPTSSFLLSKVREVTPNFDANLTAFVDRFRANIIIDSTYHTIYGEESLQEVAIGEINLKFVEKCERCSIITIDQTTSQVEGNLYNMLCKIRKGDTCVGSYFDVDFTLSHIGSYLSVGDEIQIIKRRTA